MAQCIADQCADHRAGQAEGGKPPAAFGLGHAHRRQHHLRHHREDARLEETQHRQVGRRAFVRRPLHRPLVQRPENLHATLLRGLVEHARQQRHEAVPATALRGRRPVPPTGRPRPAVRPVRQPVPAPQQ
ncbi:hypothetical protein G6F46_014945 [Rhizopus delemar]|nr:hypothetical protein G6F46_014945 [Rhizopus delemar]